MWVFIDNGMLNGRGGSGVFLYNGLSERLVSEDGLDRVCIIISRYLGRWIDIWLWHTIPANLHYLVADLASITTYKVGYYT